MTPDLLQPVSFHTTLLESIAERYRRDNDLEVTQHLEVLDIFEGLQERAVEANGVVSKIGYHVKKLPAGDGYHIRFDRLNGSIEACLDKSVYDALDASDIHASYTAVAMISDLLLRYRKLTSAGRPRNLRAIDCSPIPEARKLAEAILLPASGIQHWHGIRPDITTNELAATYKVNKPVAERRLKLFSEHRTALLAAAEFALDAGRDVRLRPQRPGFVTRAISFLINGTE